MSDELTISDFRNHWNEILDHLERENRVAWLAFFDARLEAFSNGRLTLDFSDPSKLGAGHDYHDARIRLAPKLVGAIYDVLKVNVVIVEKR